VSVTRIPEARWQEAQAWERREWEKYANPTGDDWNKWWADKFGGYAFLPRQLGDVAEIGCGPFTNIRLIRKGRETKRIVCSDPLAETYLRLPCWLAQSHRLGLIEVDAHPAEECPLPAASFDLVVMTNVLDHVRDADLCLRNAAGLVKPGGYFILGQDLSDTEDEKRFPRDIGHPIRLRLEDVSPHLAGFRSIIHRVLARAEGRNPAAHYGTLIFAGQKEGAGALSPGP